MPKSIWIKELHKNSRGIPRAKELPDIWANGEKKLSVKHISKQLPVKKLDTLFSALNSLEDIRKGKQGNRHSLASCLSIVVCGIIAGCDGLEECAEFGKALNSPQKRILRIWKHPVSKKFHAPAHTTLWRAVSSVNPADFEEAVLGWYNKQGNSFPRAIALDGKALRATINENQKGSYVVSAFPHSQNDSPFLCKHL